MSKEALSWCASQKNLKPAQFAVLDALAKLHRRDKPLSLSCSFIAKRINVSRRTVTRALKELEARGLLTHANRRHGSKFGFNEYHLQMGERGGRKRPASTGPEPARQGRPVVPDKGHRRGTKWTRPVGQNDPEVNRINKTFQPPTTETAIEGVFVDAAIHHLLFSACWKRLGYDERNPDRGGRGTEFAWSVVDGAMNDLGWDQEEREAFWLEAMSDQTIREPA